MTLLTVAPRHAQYFRTNQQHASSAPMSITGDTFPLTRMFLLCLGRFMSALVETRAALANFQRDQGLIVTGAIDEPTVEALGLY